MSISLIITFLLILAIIIAAIQNSVPLDLKFIAWNIQISVTELIAYSSIVGGAIVAILALPKLAEKSLHERRMNKEIHELKKQK